MDACSIGNLGDKAQNRRLRMGLVSVALGLVLAVVMVQTGASSLARLGLFVPFFFGAFGALQGLFRTCNGAASKDVRITDDGEEKLLESSDRERIRREGRMVVLGSFATAGMATLLCVVAV